MQKFNFPTIALQDNVLFDQKNKKKADIKTTLTDAHVRKVGTLCMLVFLGLIDYFRLLFRLPWQRQKREKFKTNITSNFAE